MLSTLQVNKINLNMNSTFGISMIIGITGTIAAGKGTVSEILEKKGFKHFSSSGLLREYLVKENLEQNRDNMHMMAKKLRSENGNNFIMKTNLERAGNSNAILESVRHPGEVEFLKKNNALVLAIDAPIEIRYKRIQSRGNSKDHVSFEKFKEQQEKDLNDSGSGCQTKACIDAADYTIINDSGVEQLEKRIDEFIEKFKDKLSIK